MLASKALNQTEGPARLAAKQWSGTGFPSVDRSAPIGNPGWIYDGVTMFDVLGHDI